MRNRPRTGASPSNSYDAACCNCLRTGEWKCAHICLSIFCFLLKKIESYPSIREAKEAGFEVVLAIHPERRMKLVLAESLAGSIWDIANTKVRTIKKTRRKGSTADDAAIFAENRALFSTLQNSFLA